jgi:hypothetical protein
MVEATLYIPLNVDYEPSGYTCRAFKEEMHCHLFNVVLAHGTVVSLFRVFMTSSKNIPGVESINKEEPSKEV